MKKHIPLIVLLVGAAWLVSTLFPRKQVSEFDLAGFGRIPVLVNGRIKPMDTVARGTLLQLQGRQRVTLPDKGQLSPIAWLATVYFESGLSDDYRTLEISHPDVLALFNLKPTDGDGKKRFSFNQLKAELPELQRQSTLAQQIETQQRSPFQRAVVQLHLNVARYQELKHSLVMPDT